MSWSVNSYYLTTEKHGIDGKNGIIGAEIEKLGAAVTPPAATDQVKDQVHLGMEMARKIIKSGAVGSGPRFHISMSGHANPDHKRTSGWANDSITIGVGDATQYTPPEKERVPA